MKKNLFSQNPKKCKAEGYGFQNKSKSRIEYCCRMCQQNANNTIYEVRTIG